MLSKLMSADVYAAMISAIVIATGWWVNSWWIGKQIEKIKGRYLLELEDVKFLNEKSLAYLKTELQGLDSHLSDRRKLLINLLDFATQARDAAWSLVNDSSSLDPTKLLTKTAHSLQAISSFFAATGNASSLVFLEDTERAQLARIGEKLSELFLKLDLDSGRKPDYERKLLESAHQLNQEVDTFTAQVRAALPISAKPAQ